MWVNINYTTVTGLNIESLKPQLFEEQILFFANKLQSAYTHSPSSTFTFLFTLSTQRNKYKTRKRESLSRI